MFDAARAILKQLEQQFPVIRDAAPLSIGVDKQLFSRLPELDRKALRFALSLHTHSPRYLKTFIKAPARVDLDGNVAGEILDDHRAHAAEILREQAKRAEQKRKEKQVAQQEQQAQRQREAKLQQLAEKFSTRR